MQSKRSHMNNTKPQRGRRLLSVLVIAVASACLMAGPAFADSTTYPAGGNGFNDGAEGWTPTGGSCEPIALLCDSEVIQDPSNGNPGGSLAMQTTLTVNLVDLFRGTGTWMSPQFSVPVGSVTGARVHLERSFSDGQLIKLEPHADYQVVLRDLTDGTEAVLMNERIDGSDGAFASRGAPAAVTGGHSYRLAIEATTGQGILALSVLSGTTAARFDNVGLTVKTAGDSNGGGKGGNGNNGGNGKSGSDESRLLASIYGNGIAGSAVLKGNRLLVRVRCPRKIAHTCRVGVQGLLTKRRPATGRSVVKVPKGKRKLVVLKVKPKFRDKLAKRKKLMVREKVRAGGARATVTKFRKLIRR
jgi:hypothetical protein